MIRELFGVKYPEPVSASHIFRNRHQQQIIFACRVILGDTENTEKHREHGGWLLFNPRVPRA